MSGPSLIAFKGKLSQTGLAAQSEFTGIEFGGADETFDDIANMVRQEEVLAVLPMWNSHEGEITKARVLELLFENEARIYRLWPKVIQFECLGRKGVTKKSIKRIVSVGVARAQCSRFIAELGAQFIPVEATTVAYRRLCRENDVDAALCAPGQNELGLKVLCADASNPMNFTSFVLLGGAGTEKWGAEKWDVIYERVNPKEGIYLGVEMGARTVSSEDQEALLTDLTADASTVDEIPKVLFVTERPPNRCGLLIEAGGEVLGSDILTEEGYSTEIQVSPYLGQTKARYPLRINDFLSENFPDVVKHNFIRHIGTQTCLFACPTFGIVTHGFDEQVVEPVVKKIIAKYFELVDVGLGCTDGQRELFERHRDAYYEQGVDFINFIDVGL